MKLYLQDPIKKYFSMEQPYFNQIMALKGECFRHREGRIIQRIRLGHSNYFIKQYRGIGWREIFKNLFQLRLPVLGASNEWYAIKKLQSIGIPTVNIIAFGECGYNPATLTSLILMEELAPTISLETLCKNWAKSPPPFLFKQALIKRVAEITKQLHENGVNHRDLYICHFLFDASQQHLHTPPLYLIDLHRAQVRQHTPLRWIIKDLASLYFSSKEIGLTQRDLYRFIQTYSGVPIRNAIHLKKSFWDKVKKRGEKLYANHA